ncbi:M23 family peptidase [Marinicauda salina]|uniref:M23 family peptidase n=1 Tax=Marinicauda salina TaxID=2135793 RepID=A0A2U2BRK2_9PROT|nr:M23 family metallopeptidase [Marinicauda salina]PWE16647.1 M23 family peptidase [Marinicauda salina]
MGERRHAGLLVVAAATLVVAACAGGPRAPADVDMRGPGSGAPPPTAAEVCGSRYTVREGDTLYSIAARCGTSVIDIAEANGLRAPYELSSGQVLELPGPEIYTVRRGDTLYQIARAHGMGVSDLATMNGLRPPYTIYPGQELRVRGGARTASTERDRDETTAETGLRIEEAPPRAPVQGTREETAPSFAWPLDGEIISRFGPQNGGRRNDGLRIGARLGEPVRAAAAGEVVYAGNELQGYGELVLIRHEGGWVSAYGHNSVLRVDVGDRVEQGDVIADAGATGSAERPQLHFEIRRGVTPVDPLEHLPSR